MNKSVVEIAALYGVHKKVILRIIKENGIPYQLQVSAGPTGKKMVFEPYWVEIIGEAMKGVVLNNHQLRAELKKLLARADQATDDLERIKRALGM